MAHQQCGPVLVAACKTLGIAFAVFCFGPAGAISQQSTGRHGGWLQVAQRAEPRTFNPATAIDTPSQDLISQLHSDLIHINRSTLMPEPGLAHSWTVSPNGRIYTLNLRRNVRFSDGRLMDADDVVFTFEVYLDAKTNSTQRDLLTVHGKPVIVRKTGTHTVEFELTAPYASAERLFDGVAILPRHLLLEAYKQGRMARAWGIDIQPDQIAGTGPFRLKQYIPGERAVLERNPFYWKFDGKQRQLPYLEGLVFHFLPNEELHIMKLIAGELSIVERLSAANFLEVRKQERSRNVRVYDAGPSLEYQFLVFNLNDIPAEAGVDVKRKQTWFRNLRFRQAVSLAIDRSAVSKLAYSGLADPIWGHVTPGNGLWRDQSISRPARSLESARSLLRSASFSWKNDRLLDPAGNPVEFSILVSATNKARGRAATIIQDDLRQLGMKVAVVSLESRTMSDRVFNRREYDAAMMAIDSNDVDPNSEMNIWLSSGHMHIWNLSGKPHTPWEEEVDRLMRRQMTLLDRQERKRVYGRVQQLIAENLPFIFVTSPHVLLGASGNLGNFTPSALRPNGLWNVEWLYFR